MIGYAKHPDPSHSADCALCRVSQHEIMINPIQEHPYHCLVCHDGTVSKELWEMLYGVNLGLHNCGKSNPKHNDLKIWIGKRLDAIDSHGCSSCWSDSHSCTCKEEKEQMVNNLLSELPVKFAESFKAGMIKK